MTKLSDLGFKPVGGHQRRAFISGEGPAKVGKTHFFRTCPPPIGVLDFDMGLEGIAELDIWGNPIMRIPFPMPDLDEFSKTASPGQRQMALALYTKLKTVTLEALKSGELRTLGVDTGTAAYALAQIARFGQMAVVGEVPPSLWTAMQAEFEGIFNKYADYNCNLVIMHRQGTKYRGVAGETELKGYKPFQFLSQVHLDFQKRTVRDATGKAMRNAVGGEQNDLIRVVKSCRQRRSLEGMEFPVYFVNEEQEQSIGGDFATIVQAMFPMSKPEEWGLPR